MYVCGCVKMYVLLITWQTPFQSWFSYSRLVTKKDFSGCLTLIFCLETWDMMPLLFMFIDMIRRIRNRLWFGVTDAYY